MKTDRELLQQALDALLHSDSPSQKRADAIAALREALAAPQPEPYGHVTTHTVTGQQFFYRYPSPPYLDTAKECIAVYAAPPAAPAPAVPAISPLALRALRMADMALASWENGYAFDSHGPGREAQRLVTDALALSAAPAAPDGAVPPGSWEHLKVMMQHSAWEGTLQLSDALANIDDFAKSAAPAVREPLTDEQIDALWSSPMSADWEHREFARAIESAHGIGKD